MKKVTKGAAFIIGIFCIMAMFIAVALLRVFDLAETNELMAGSFLMATVSLVTSYMGIDVANNAARGKWFNENIPKLDAERDKK